MEIKKQLLLAIGLLFFSEKKIEERRARGCVFLCGGLCSIDENSWGGEGVARAVWIE